MKTLLREGRGALSRVQALAKAAQSSAGRFSGAMLEERAIRFLPPVPDADQFLCLGEHHREARGDLTGLVKPNASLVGHNAKVPVPNGAVRLECEPELVFVIGRRVLGFTPDKDAMDYVVGVTVLGDITDRDSRAREIFDPLGPEIVTLDELGDPYDLWLTCVVNGEERMRVNSGGQVAKMGDMLEHFSRDAALEPGDMFSTAAPGARSGPGALSLKAGDVVECSIEGITTLRATLVAE
jgi:5-carboxymethyl-2-hydroxymuconate isomerase/acylpyruvate hydrolase